MKLSAKLGERLRLVLISSMAWFGYFFLLMPTLVVVPMSFADRDVFEFPPRKMSLYLYGKYFEDPMWMGATRESLVVATCSASLALVLGVGISFGLARRTFWGKRLIALFLMSPLFVPTIVVALACYRYFFLFHLNGTTIGLVLAHALITIPFVIVTVLAGLRQVDPALETAARIMGASHAMTLRKITLPLIRPSIVAAGLFAFLISFDEVVIAHFLTGARTETLPVRMYSSIRWEISAVLAAIASLLTVLSCIVCVTTALLQKKETRNV